jgi:hypothetical protein
MSIYWIKLFETCYNFISAHFRSVLIPLLAHMLSVLMLSGDMRCMFNRFLLE